MGRALYFFYITFIVLAMKAVYKKNTSDKTYTGKVRNGL